MKQKAEKKTGFLDLDLILLRGAEDSKCLEMCAEFYRKTGKAAETLEMPKEAFRKVYKVEKLKEP